MMQVHLLTQDPAAIINPVLGNQLTVQDLRILDQFTIQGAGYQGTRIQFSGARGWGNSPATFAPATRDWPTVTHWMVLEYRNGTTSATTLPRALGCGQLKTPVVVLQGETAELLGTALIKPTPGGLVTSWRPGDLAELGILAARVQPSPPLPTGGATWSSALVAPSPGPHTWVSNGPDPVAPVPAPSYHSGGCECGAEKTWGPGAGGHSSWCPKARNT